MISHSLFADQIAAAIEGFFWPKVFWDFLTTNLDSAVKPVPILQIINLVFGLACLAYEWPLKFIGGTAFHRSIEARLILVPLLALAAVVLYQGTNAAIYYLIAVAIYFWAYSEGEVCGGRDSEAKCPDLLIFMCYRQYVLNHGHCPSASSFHRLLDERKRIAQKSLSSTVIFVLDRIA
jgi:hypothetical protein